MPLHGSLDGRGVWRRKDACIYMAESLCCPPETITTLLIGYMLIQNKKLKNKGWVSAIHWPILYLSKYLSTYLSKFI